MNTVPPPLALLLATLFAAAPALADEAGQADHQVREERRVINVREMRPFEPGALAGAGLRIEGKVVKNLPYSAEVISERQQNLADGNQIVHRSTANTWRDSAGRTRQEMRDDKGEVRTITIHDPVAGTTTILNPASKTATRISPPRLAEAARARIEALRKDGKLPEQRHEIIMRRSDSDGDSVSVTNGNGGPVTIVTKEMRVEGRRPNEMMLGPLGGSFADIKWSGKASVKDLGQRDIDGVRAEGKQRSYEIPAGAIGNRNPIVVTDESWFAPELQITVLTKHSDPRMGENVYRVAAIKREEPAAALFTVPSDYTVKEPMAQMQRERRGEPSAR